MSVTGNLVRRVGRYGASGMSVHGLVLVISICLLFGMHPASAEDGDSTVVSTLLEEMETTGVEFDISKLERLPIAQFKLLLNELMPESAVVGDVDPQEVTALIHQLGSDSFPEREEATLRLVGMPHMALPQLNEAVANPDLEIAQRALSILRTKARLDKPDPAVARATARQYGKAYRKFLRSGASREQLELIAMRTMMAMRMGRKNCGTAYDIMWQGILAVGRSMDDDLINLFEPAIILDIDHLAFWVLVELRSVAPESALIMMVKQVELGKPEKGVADPFNPFGRAPGAPSPFGEPDDPTPNPFDWRSDFRKKFEVLRKRRM